MWSTLLNSDCGLDWIARNKRHSPRVGYELITQPLTRIASRAFTNMIFSIFLSCTWLEYPANLKAHVCTSVKQCLFLWEDCTRPRSQRGFVSILVVLAEISEKKRGLLIFCMTWSVCLCSEWKTAKWDGHCKRLQCFMPKGSGGMVYISSLLSFLGMEKVKLVLLRNRKKYWFYSIRRPITTTE